MAAALQTPPNPRPPTQIQSLEFDAGIFTPKAARKWAGEHGFRSPRPDIKATTIRIRQIPPHRFTPQSFRTIDLRPGVKAVIGRMAGIGKCQQPDEAPPSLPAAGTWLDGPVPKITRTTHPPGIQHTAATIRKMAALVQQAAASYPIRHLATLITHHVPSKRPDLELAAIYTWTRDNIRYRHDPTPLEWLQTPERTVKEMAGDCDDLATLIAALAESLGHKTRFLTVGPGPQQQQHIAAQAWTGEKWITLDPVLERARDSIDPIAGLGAFGRTPQGYPRLWSSTTGSPIQPAGPGRPGRHPTARTNARIEPGRHRSDFLGIAPAAAYAAIQAGIAAASKAWKWYEENVKPLMELDLSTTKAENAKREQEAYYRLKPLINSTSTLAELQGWSSTYLDQWSRSIGIDPVELFKKPIETWPPGVVYALKLTRKLTQKAYDETPDSDPFKNTKPHDQGLTPQAAYVMATALSQRFIPASLLQQLIKQYGSKPTKPPGLPPATQQPTTTPTAPDRPTQISPGLVAPYSLTLPRAEQPAAARLEPSDLPELLTETREIRRLLTRADRRAEQTAAAAAASEADRQTERIKAAALREITGLTQKRDPRTGEYTVYANLGRISPTISFALGALPPGKLYPATWVNQLLIDLGFDPGGVSGWGEKSRTALKAAAQKFALSYYSSTNRYEDPPGSGKWKSYGTGQVMVRPDTLIPALELKRQPKAAAPTATPAAAASARAGTAPATTAKPAGATAPAGTAPATTTRPAGAAATTPTATKPAETPYAPPAEREAVPMRYTTTRAASAGIPATPPQDKDLPPVRDLEKEIASLKAKVKALRAALAKAEADLAACQKKKGKKKQTAIATSNKPILAGKDNTWIWLAVAYLAARK